MRRKGAKTVLSSDSEDDKPLSKIRKVGNDDDSSSDSDIENYLKPADKLDLNSEFFSVQKEPSFDSIEKEILGGVTRLSSDSESEKDDSEKDPQPSTSKYNFAQLHEYTKKMEEAKRHLENYQKAKKDREKDLDVDNLLAIGESKNNDIEITNNDTHFSDSDSDQEAWEEVKEVYKEKNDQNVTAQDVVVNIELPTSVKKKKEIDLMAVVKRRINRIKKENQVLVHKVHILGWIAHGNYVSSTINCQSVLGMALSLIPSEKCYPSARTDLKYLEQILKWFRNCVDIPEKDKNSDERLGKSLQNQMEKKKALNRKMLVYIFIAIMRALGIQCRLVLSLQVEPLRPSNSELFSLSTKNDSKPTSNKRKLEETEKVDSKKVERSTKINKSKSKTIEAKNKINQEKKSQTVKPTVPKELKVMISPLKAANNDIRKKEVKSKTQKELKVVVSPLKTTKTDIKKKDKATEQNKKKNGIKKSDNVRPTRSSKRTIPQLDGAGDTVGSKKPNLSKLTPKRKSKKIIKYEDTDSEEEFDTPRKKVNLKKLNDVLPKTKVRNDIIDIVKSSIKEKKDLMRGKRVSKKKVEDSDDSDYMPEEIKKKDYDSEDQFVEKIKVKRRVGEKRPEDEKKKKVGNDVWAEVFLETEEKWISVDVVKGQIHCVKELANRASHPISYILAWNNDNKIKDVTKRYCMNFNTITRKLRVDSKWFEATLKPYLPKQTAREKEEDDEFERQQLEKPLPVAISEYKNHPMYVLERHLLKFEALYPPNVAPIGFVRKEPVYPRQNVYTLHSRELWLKEARVVKPGEEPYKIVKARPKWDKSSGKMITDLMLEVFGYWQTQDYEPPTAENGKVPRNAFGNVELFKECMLPKGCVQLRLAGLNKIARRMNIDCATAVVGFDFHGGWNHPVYDGFVVCEEFADQLVMAWELEQEELEKKQREKIEKRVYGNWKKLIRGLYIRERLKLKYEFEEPSTSKKKK